jgi:hypothetical protein
MKPHLLFLLLTAAGAQARLGDTLDQAEERYGLPKSEKIPVATKPLLEGAIERTFRFEGWRIRTAFLKASDGNEYIVREQFWKEKDGPLLKDFEVKALLEAEANGQVWKAKERGDASANPVKTIQNQLAQNLEGHTWTRTDRATANLGTVGTHLSLELPQAKKWEADLKAITDAKAKAAVPNF